MLSGSDKNEAARGRIINTASGRPVCQGFIYTSTMGPKCPALSGSPKVREGTRAGQHYRQRLCPGIHRDGHGRTTIPASQAAVQL